MNSDVEQFKEKAIQRIDRLTHFALNANEHYKAIFDSRKLFNEHREVYDMAGFYFQAAVYSHYTYIFLALSKMFCDREDGDESSLNLLTKIVNRNDQEFNHPFDVTEFDSTFSDSSHIIHFSSPKEAYEIIMKEIAKYNPIIENIRALRNKYYAHMDYAKSKDYSKFFEEKAVTMEDVDKLLNLNFTICNCINALLRNTTVYNDVMKAGSLDLLAKYAEKGKEVDKKEREKIYDYYLNKKVIP